MEDFTALAGSLSGSVGDARGVLILSRDGLLLGAYPTDAESQLKTAWLRFASLGEPERGFVQFGTEIWSYVRRGAYAAFVVSATSVRPGLVLDQIEMVLLAAEESRSRREGLRNEPPVPPTPAAPSGKPRTPLHPEPRPVAQPPAVIRAEAAPTVSLGVTPSPAAAGDTEPRDFAGTPASTGDAAGRSQAPAGDAPERRQAPTAQPPAVPPPSTGGTPTTGKPAGEGATPAPQEPGPKVPEAPSPPPRRPQGSSVWGRRGDATDEEGPEEVDRFSLEREFSQLLQEDSDGADG